jgi:uncharacterized membrane protein YgcG
MSTDITAVQGNTVISCLLMELDIDGTTYYISNAYKPVTYNSNTYTELGSFLSVTEFTEDIKATNGDISVVLSGIPSEQNYLGLILNTKIKGGTLKIYRGFFDQNTLELDTGQVYLRFSGIITNYAITEDTNTFLGEITNSVTVTCASINTILENKISGQRTNPADRKRLFPNDEVFDRVPELYNITFDFGKEYVNRGGGYGRGGGGSGGGGGGRDRTDKRQMA